MYAVIAPFVRLPRNRHFFDYSVPSVLQKTIAPGQFVEVYFRGANKVKGIVLGTHTQKPNFPVRDILRILTPSPLLSVPQLALARWISQNTFTSLSVVLKSFLPVIRMRDVSDLTPLPEIEKRESQKPVLAFYHSTEARNEFYKKNITETLAREQSVLILVPRAPHVHELQNALGNNDNTISILPTITDAMRWCIWKMLRNAHKPYIAIGTRGALFLPMTNLGLIIIDQEHDENLKQEEPNPRYDAKESAIMLAKLTGAKIIFGSQIPNIETYSRTKSGEFDLQELGNETQPNIAIINISEERKKESFTYITPPIMDAISETLALGKSVFLFLDRLGSATFITCADCSYEFRCKICKGMLTFYKEKKSLHCHHCGEEADAPLACPMCHGVHIKLLGYGTERITDVLKQFSKSWRVVRLDSLTNESTEINYDTTIPTVIVGTRYALPFLPWNSLGFIGILKTDQLLHYPEFRSQERTYRLLKMLASHQLRVLIQATEPEHWILGALTKNYETFYNIEKLSRVRWGYPPAKNLIRLIMQTNDEAQGKKEVQKLIKKLRQALPADINLSDPYPLNPYRVRGRWRIGVLLKIPTSKPIDSLSLDKLVPNEVIIDVSPTNVT